MLVGISGFMQLSDHWPRTGCNCGLKSSNVSIQGDLPHVQERPEFQRANAGFAYEYQLVDVQDFNGVGESEPNPYFYQVWHGLG